MADPNRRDPPVDRKDTYEREDWRSGPGGGQQGESFHSAAGVPGQPEDGFGAEGQTYGQAGGYNRGPGESRGGFADGQAGSAQGEGGPSQTHADDGGYTGQTGTGYGQTLGGEAGREDGGDDGGLWGRARHAVSGVLGGGSESQDGAHRGRGAGAESQDGPHRGRGPKNYSRSDERIREDVNDRLTDDPFLDATHIEVAAQGGEVTLSGTVTGSRDKRRAEDLAHGVSGVKRVHNDLRVEEAGLEPDR